jgi:hypothetical protein
MGDSTLNRWNNFIVVGRFFDDTPTPGADKGGEGNDDGADKPDANKEKLPAGEKMISQTEVNRIVADEKRKTKAKLDEHLKAINDVSQTAKEREAAIENLKNEFLTKEELARKDSEKKEKEYKGKVTNLEQERDSWKNRYTDSQIEVSIMTAAEKGEAFNSTQILNILRQKAKLVEGLDEDGKPNGSLVTRVSFKDTDKDGKEITLDLAPDAVIKRMKEMPEVYGNLFKANVSTGIGGNNVTGVKTGMPNLNNTEAYRAWRKEQQKAKK